MRLRARGGGEDNAASPAAGVAGGLLQTGAFTWVSDTHQPLRHTAVRLPVRIGIQRVVQVCERIGIDDNTERAISPNLLCLLQQRTVPRCGGSEGVLKLCTVAIWRVRQ